ncbi:MAG TPA: Wzz/FepE/Etk N-terminal domain-containing protein [Candidatus Acidoferrum sp.]|nr:Wzz/FepE/Etk N-terminal domain-containing protein [Candidatus Acidoferrum sp.]
MNFTSSAPPNPITDAPQNGHSVMYAFPDLVHKPSKRVLYLRMFWEQRRFLLRVGIYAVLASILLAFLVPPRYKAKAQLMPPEGQQGLGGALLGALSSKGAAGALGGLAGDLLGSKNSGALFVGVLNSRTVADHLIEQFNLQHLYHDAKLEDARDDLESHSEITEDRKSGILSIAVTDHSPQRAAAMAQAYVTELDRLVSQLSTSSARRERIFLEGRLLEVKGDLDVAAKKFSDFASKNTALDIPAQGKAMMEAAATLQGQLIAAESELSGLQQIYADSNVRVRSLKARVSELNQELEKMGGDAANPANGEGLMAPPIRKLPLLGITYADLFRQNKIEETVYELLTQQYEMAKVQEAKEIPTVKILDAPVPPTKKLFPGPLALIVLGTILGLAGGAAWLVLREKWKEGDPGLPGRVLVRDIGASLRVGTRRLTPARATAERKFTGDAA